MAELTEQEKIAIGVCAAVGGLILIGIIIFICLVFIRRNKRYTKRRYIYNDERERHIYNDRPYTVMDDYKPPPPLYYGPARPPSYRHTVLPPPPAPLPPPPPAPMREVREVVYRKPAPVEPLHVPWRYEGYETHSEPPRPLGRFYRGEFRYNDREEPIVIPLSEPEYLYSGSKMTRPTTHYIRYNDDQALLRSSFDRRPYGELRRTYSFGDVRDVRRSRRPYVGEWVARSDDLDDFNREAYNKGRDPFLWKNSHKDYDYVRRIDD